MMSMQFTGLLCTCCTWVTKRLTWRTELRREKTTILSFPVQDALRRPKHRGMEALAITTVSTFGWMGCPKFDPKCHKSEPGCLSDASETDSSTGDGNQGDSGSTHASSTTEVSTSGSLTTTSSESSGTTPIESSDEESSTGNSDTGSSSTTGGEPLPLCMPHETRCVGNTEIQVCNAQGMWDPPQPCEDQACVHGECSGECEPGQKQCKGHEAQTCSSSGDWSTHESCEVPEQECEAGTCIACQPWETQFGTNENDIAYAIAVDHDGNLYVGGYQQGGDPDTPNGKEQAFIARFDAKGKQVWSKSFGSNGDDKVRGIAVDIQGHVYLAGYTQGSLEGQTSQGGADAFMAKYDSQGNQLWIRQFGSNKDDFAYTIAIDKQGTVYLGGASDGELPENESKGGKDAFVAKYDTGGNQLWIKQFGTTEDDQANGIAVSQRDKVYLVGDTKGSFSEHENEGGQDVFIVRFDTKMEVRDWTEQIGTNEHDKGNGIAIDSQGMVFISGYTWGSFQGNEAPQESDVFMTKYDANGNNRWDKPKVFGSTKQDDGISIAVDRDGMIYLGGHTQGPIHGTSHKGETDAFFTQFDLNANALWTETKAISTRQHDYGHSITVGPRGRLYLVGETEGTLEGNSSEGKKDAFVAHLCRPDQ